MSELTGNRVRTTAGKLGLLHLAETITEPASPPPSAATSDWSASPHRTRSSSAQRRSRHGDPSRWRGPPCLTCLACFVLVCDPPAHRLPVQFCGDRAACRNQPLGHAIDLRAELLRSRVPRGCTPRPVRRQPPAPAPLPQDPAARRRRVRNLWPHVLGRDRTGPPVLVQPCGDRHVSGGHQGGCGCPVVLELSDSRSFSFVLPVALSWRSERLSALTPVAGQGAGGSDPGAHDLVRTRILVRAHGGGGGGSEAC